MTENINGFKAAVTAILAGLTALWGWFGWLVWAWVGCMALDYQDETAYNREQDRKAWEHQAESDAWDRAMANWQMTGVLDEAGAAVLGIPAGTKSTDYQYQLAQMAKMSASGSGGRRTGDKTESPGEGDYDGLFAAARKSGNPQNYIASHYKDYGFTSSAGLWSQYGDEYMYDESNVSDNARYWYTDINRLTRSREGQLDQIDALYRKDQLNDDEYKWMLDKFGLL